MKKILSMLIVLVLLINPTTLYANETEIKGTIINHVVVYADHDNKEEVLFVAQQAFDQGADSVEVVNTSNYSIQLFAAGWNETKSPMYYFGDVLHGSQATIRAYVIGGNGTSGQVSNCSLNVEVWGTGTSLYQKNLVNPNTMYVSGNWRIKVSGFMNAYSPTYSVSLF